MADNITGRISRSAAEYKRRFYALTDNTGAFRVSDFYEALQIADGDIYELMSTCFNSGFMIGYRRGVAECKKRNRQTRMKCPAFMEMRTTNAGTNTEQ